MRTMMLTMHSTMMGAFSMMDEVSADATAMGQAFDAARNDDSFYLPPEVFDNPDFKRGMKMFISPDGKSVRFIISHIGQPSSAEGIAHIDAIRRFMTEAGIAAGDVSLVGFHGQTVYHRPEVRFTRQLGLGEKVAEALGIDRDYGLIVRYGDGREETVRSGEVSVRGLYGYIE